MKIIIDAKKHKLNESSCARGCSKSNLRLAIILAWLESYNTGNPVEFECGFELVNIELK